MIIVKLKELLEQKDKSIYWLAEATGLSYPGLHRLANKQTNSISFDSLAKICVALDCNIWDVIEFIKESD